MNLTDVQRITQTLEKLDPVNVRRAGFDIGRVVRSAPLAELRALQVGVAEVAAKRPEHEYLRALCDVLESAVGHARMREEQGRLLETVEREPTASVMQRLADEQGQTTSELSAFLGRTAPQVSRLVSELRAQELVESWTPSGDERSRVHVLTMKGMDLLEMRRGLSGVARDMVCASVDFFEELIATGRIYRAAFEKRLAEKLGVSRAYAIATMLVDEVTRRNLGEVTAGVVIARTSDMVSDLDRWLEQDQVPESLSQLLKQMQADGVNRLIIRAEQITRDRWLQIATLASVAIEIEIEVMGKIDVQIEAPAGEADAHATHYLVAYDAEFNEADDQANLAMKPFLENARGRVRLNPARQPEFAMVAS